MTKCESEPADMRPDDEATERAVINAETAKIPWVELQRFFAQGVVVSVMPGLDLVEVALQMRCDNARQLDAWMRARQVRRVSDAQAREWLEANALVWCVVVKPWVVVQPVVVGLDDVAAEPSN